MSELMATASIRDLAPTQGKASHATRLPSKLARDVGPSARSSFAAVLSKSETAEPTDKLQLRGERTQRDQIVDEDRAQEDMTSSDESAESEVARTTATSERPKQAGALRNSDDDTGAKSRPQLGRGRGNLKLSAFEAAGVAQQEDATTALLQRKLPSVLDADASSEVARKMTVISATEQIVDQGAMAAKTSEGADVPVAAPDVAAADSATPDVKAASPTAEPVRVAAPSSTAAPAPIPARAMAAVQAALTQDGTRVKIFENGARLSLQLSDGSEISMRLLMRDGAVDIRAAGVAAGLLESRAPELRAALSSEGLKLGTFSAGAGSSGTDSNGQDSDATASLYDDGDAADFGSGRGKTAPGHETSVPARRMHNGKSVVA